jgi:hypothetical protein
VKEEAEERELSQLFDLLGGGRDRADWLLDLAELDTADLEPDWEEDSDLMAFVEEMPPMYRWD